ncbi:mediator of RNA polymerase II transcription subunit 25-like [Phalaenopsis equestris]|uniref:mediator of RNA polymerase II transcription subunit 25-like n=1 Tax=Phalaenopsis equestris TaxID=78828 RepID=UPI0009E28E4C|nr:mediator of RNA polymerase II transcription subunit 25-like [Phalaenopsis equestris]
MAEKQLIVVVEGTAALGPYWQTLVSEYLEKILRCFCGNELNGQYAYCAGLMRRPSLTTSSTSLLPSKFGPSNSSF